MQFNKLWQSWLTHVFQDRRVYVTYNFLSRYLFYISKQSVTQHSWCHGQTKLTIISGLKTSKHKTVITLRWLTTTFPFAVSDLSSKTHQSAWPVQTQMSCPQCCSSTSSAWTGTGTPWYPSWLRLRCTSCGPGTAGTASSGPADRTAAQERLAQISTR